MNTEILVVEDDPAIATGLGLNLKLEGYLPTLVHDGGEAATILKARRFALVLLDIGLPTKDGLSLLSELRDGGDHTPVVVLSAREGEYDKVAALRLGADDYVTKPFALAELMARVHAVLRRAKSRSDSTDRSLRFGEVVINLDTRAVHRSAQLVRLTHLEFELLLFLCNNPARVFTRDELLRKVWGASNGSRRTVDNFVAQLRAKLETDPEAPRYLVTVRGSGYRFDP